MPLSGRDPATRLRRRAVMALALWLALAAAVAVALWHQRQRTVDSQARELALLAAALGDSVSRGLDGVNEALHELRNDWLARRLPLEPADERAALQARARWTPLVEALWVVAPDARVLAGSAEVEAPLRQGFDPPLATLQGETVALSLPHAAPSGAGSWLAMALSTPERPGASARWLLAGLPRDALLGTLRSAPALADARLALIRADGQVLDRTARATDVHGGSKALPDAALEGGWGESTQAVQRRRDAEGREHLVAMHRIDRYGLQVLVSRELPVVLAPWQTAVEGAAALLAVLLLVLAATVAVMYRAERRRRAYQQALQAQRSRSSKLESLGTLAGSVAHDFNNVLAAIVGYGEMARDAATDGTAQARHLDKVLQAGLRGKDLVERVLKFSRGGATVSTVFALEPVVDEVLGLLAATLKPGVVLERSLQARDGHVRGDPTQAFEAVMNLCTNGLQAMPHGGTLGVQMQRERVSEARILSHAPLPAGRYLVVTVQDQGTGIAAEVMDHLFEPFFTTRAAQSGTGLGLAVVHGAMAEFKGAVDVQSPPQGGAVFRLYFPETDAPVAMHVDAAQGDATGHGQRIAVVDDEPELVALASEVLRQLGYVPVGFADARQALGVLGEPGHGCAALVTDELMPGLTGLQLVRALRERDSTIPVLMLSGYGGASLAERAAAAGVRQVLTKPLQRADLARALAELLADTGA